MTATKRSHSDAIPMLVLYMLSAPNLLGKIVSIDQSGRHASHSLAPALDSGMSKGGAIVRDYGSLLDAQVGSVRAALIALDSSFGMLILHDYLKYTQQHMHSTANDWCLYN